MTFPRAILVLLLMLPLTFGAVHFAVAPVSVWEHFNPTSMNDWRLGFAWFIALITAMGVAGASYTLFIKRDHYSDARWARFGDLKELRKPPKWKEAPPLPLIWFGPWWWRVQLFSYLYRLVIVDGAAGTGKTQAIIKPMLLCETTDSAIVLDPAGELFRDTSGHRARMGHKIIVLSTTGDYGHRYNPFLAVNPKRRLDELQFISHSWLEKGHEKAIWHEGARNLMDGLACLIWDTQGQHSVTFGNITRLLNFPGPLHEHVIAQCKLPSVTDLTKQLLIPWAVSAVETRDGQARTLSAQLSVFLNDFMDRVTSASDFEWEELRNQPVTVYLKTQDNRLEQYGKLQSLMVNTFIRRMLDKEPDEDALGVNMFLEELGSYVQFDQLIERVSDYRKYKLRPIVIMQGPSRLRAKYGDDMVKNMLNNTYARIFYSPSDPNVQEEVVAGLDTYTQSQYVPGERGWTRESHSKNLLERSELQTMRTRWPKAVLMRVMDNYPIFSKYGVKSWRESKVLSKLVSIPAATLPAIPEVQWSLGPAPTGDPGLDADAIA